MSGLTTFLLARYDDEVAAIRLKRCAECGSYQNAPDDPATARLLADVDAKRAIVSECERSIHADRDPSFAEWVVRNLAEIHGNHADHDEGWRP